MTDKYKTLYELSFRAYLEEKERFNRIDEKASKYFSIIVVFIGITGFWGKWVIDTLVPPEDALSVILFFLGCSLSVSVLYSFWYTFSVLRIHQLQNMPLDESVFNLVENQDDNTVFYTISKSLKQFRSNNIEITNKKAYYLFLSYRGIICSTIFFILFVMFYAGYISTHKIQTIKEGTFKMAEKEKPRDVKQEPTPKTPDKNVPPLLPDVLPLSSDTSPNKNLAILRPELLTEGYDPKKGNK